MTKATTKVCPLCGKHLGVIMGKKCKGDHRKPWKSPLWNDWKKDKNSEKWKKYIKKWRATLEKNRELNKDTKEWRYWNIYNKRMPYKYQKRKTRKHKKK